MKKSIVAKEIFCFCFRLATLLLIMLPQVALIKNISKEGFSELQKSMIGSPLMVAFFMALVPTLFLAVWIRLGSVRAYFGLYLSGNMFWAILSHWTVRHIFKVTEYKPIVAFLENDKCVFVGLIMFGLATFLFWEKIFWQEKKDEEIQNKV